MKRLPARSVLIAALLLSTSIVSSAETTVTKTTITNNTTSVNTAAFSATQTEAIQKIVHDYLVSQPQVLIEAARALQAQQIKQEAELQANASTVVPKLTRQLFDNGVSPVIGNPTGSITLVEFFDYQCPHCKESGPQVNDLIKKNKNLRVVLKSLPIFGDNSEFAAKAGLAAEKQGKFLPFYDAMLATPNRLTSEEVLKLAQQSGLNIAQLKKDMENPAISQELKNNYNFAKQLKLIGTPAFIFAKTDFNSKTKALENTGNPLLIPGAVNEAILTEAMNQVQSGQNSKSS